MSNFGFSLRIVLSDKWVSQFLIFTNTILAMFVIEVQKPREKSLPKLSQRNVYVWCVAPTSDMVGGYYVHEAAVKGDDYYQTLNIYVR